MPGEFDSTTRYLVSQYPADWLAFLGLSAPGQVSVVDANLSTVSAEADKAVRIEGERPRIAHIEFQSSYDPTMGQRMLRYNAMLHVEYSLPVASMLVLLRRSAGGPAITGRYAVSLEGESPYVTFTYGVRRIWQEPAADFLIGALGTLPLAPLAASTRAKLPGLLQQMDERFADEAPLAEAAKLRVVTYTLLGLRFRPEIVDQLMPGLHAMRDSLTYQAIIAEGRAEGLSQGVSQGEQRLILRMGSARFGAPDGLTRSRIEAITSTDTLERLGERILTVSSWNELLADL